MSAAAQVGRSRVRCPHRCAKSARAASVELARGDRAAEAIQQAWRAHRAALRLFCVHCFRQTDYGDDQAQITTLVWAKDPLAAKRLFERTYRMPDGLYVKVYTYTATDVSDACLRNARAEVYELSGHMEQNSW
tara:strand:- start:3867 stop:4265 length:399 start_codon:yes stop_codon:yes gene_type:complete